MIDQEARDRIGWWALKAGNQNDFYVKFILYWFCFNAWITKLSGSDKDKDAIRWFLENRNDLRDVRNNFWDSSDTQAILNELKRDSPVGDNRPGHQQDNERHINDISDVNEVVWFIYQIRCNLFHGTKNPNNTRDSRLVENSAIIIKKWIENALLIR